MINGKTFLRVGGQVEVNEGVALRGYGGVVVMRQGVRRGYGVLST